MLLLLDLLVLGALAVPCGRLIGHRVVRRELRARPLAAAGAVVAAVLLVAALLVLAKQPGPIFHLAVAAMAGVAGFLSWRARTAYGAGRGLPPGTLGLRASLDAIDNPDFYLRMTRRYGPVFKMAQVHQPVACITDVALGHELLERDTDTIAQSDWPLNRLFPGGYVEFMNGEQHARYRALLTAGLAPDAIAGCEGEFRDVVAKVMEAARALPGPTPLDTLPLQLTFPMLARTVLGLRVDDSRVGALHTMTSGIPYFGVHLPVPRRVRRAWAAATDLVATIAREQVALPDPVRSVLADLVKREPRALDDPIVIGNLVIMLKDGHEIVAGQLRWMLRALARETEWVASLRTAPEDRVDRLTRSFVHESLRLWTTRYVYRRVVRETLVGGYRLPKGWLVRVCYDQAHQDAAVFPAPRQFEADRFASVMPAPEAYCPFGHGKHACPGGELTMRIVTVVLSEVALRYDLRVVQDGAPERHNRHWAFWQPSDQLRIRISPRDGGSVVT